MNRPFLTQIFGNSVQVHILDALCNLSLGERQTERLQWLNLSQLAQRTHVAKSSVKRVIDQMLEQQLVMEKPIATHAQNPPREMRLNENHPAVKELVFFYQKVRGFL